MTKEIIPGNKLEHEKAPSAGTILAIVGIDPSKNGENISNPRLWTIIETHSKGATDKIRGQISFPADTRKINEDEYSNLLGSLAEFTEKDSIVREGIYLMPTSFTGIKVPVKGNPIDLAIIFLDGFYDSKITPLDSEEVSANGWMSLNELREKDPSQLRSFVRQILQLEDHGRVISGAVEDYFKNPQKRIPLSNHLPQDFSIRGFYNEREKHLDVLKNYGVVFEASTI